MSKDLNYYLSLDYDINIKPIAVEDGGGWLATIPLLEGCMSDGSTPDEAFKNVIDAQKDWVEFCLEEGISIPEPNLSAQEYSGKFTLRTRKSIHQKLAEKAAQEKVSLNNLVNEYIISGLTEQKVANNYLNTIKEVINPNRHACSETKPSEAIQYRNKINYDHFLKEAKCSYANLAGFTKENLTSESNLKFGIKEISLSALKVEVNNDQSSLTRNNNIELLDFKKEDKVTIVKLKYTDHLIVEKSIYLELLAEYYIEGELTLGELKQILESKEINDIIYPILSEASHILSFITSKTSGLPLILSPYYD